MPTSDTPDHLLVIFQVVYEAQEESGCLRKDRCELFAFLPVAPDSPPLDRAYVSGLYPQHLMLPPAVSYQKVEYGKFSGGILLTHQLLHLNKVHTAWLLEFDVRIQLLG